MTEDGMITPAYSDYSTRNIIHKLADYEDFEEQGLLLRLPCKVGDFIYYPSSYHNVVIPVRVDEITISFMGIDNFSFQYNCCSFDGCGDVYDEYEFDNSDIGKTVFLTQSEAEKKLKSLNDENILKETSN